MSTFDRNAGASEFDVVPSGLYMCRFVDWVSGWKTRNDGTEYAVGNMEVVEVLDGAPDAVGLIAPFSVNSPLDVLERTSSWEIWLAKFGISTAGIDFSDPDEALDMVKPLMLEAPPIRVFFYETGWPSFVQLPPGAELLVVFHGFAYFDPEVGRPKWKMEESNYKDKDGNPKLDKRIPPLFRVIHGLFMNTIARYEFLNYTIVAIDVDGEKVYGGGGPQAKFAPFCLKVGVDLKTLIETDATGVFDELLDEVEIGENPNILHIVEREALKAADAGHILKVRTTDRGYLDYDTLTLCSELEMKRLTGETKIAIPELKRVGVDSPQAEALLKEVKRVTGERVIEAKALSYAEQLNKWGKDVPKVTMLEGENFTSDGLGMARLYMAPFYDCMELDRTRPLDVPKNVQAQMMYLLYLDEYRGLCEGKDVPKIMRYIEEALAEEKTVKKGF